MGRFATDDKGGDLIALVAYIEGIKQGEAANRLSQFLGLSHEKSDARKRATSSPSKAGDISTPPTIKKSGWAAVLPIPVNAGNAPMHHKYGKPSMSWKYHDALGNVLCLLHRFESQQGVERKQFMPLTYCKHESGKHEWRWQGLQEPRPLYNLHHIAKRKDDIVIVWRVKKQRTRLAFYILMRSLQRCLTALRPLVKQTGHHSKGVRSGYGLTMTHQGVSACSK